MMENQQLIKKDRSANSYSKIFPWTFTDLVLDRVTKESLDNILVRNNFIALPYVGSKAATRLQVPMKNRRRGIWLSYIDYAGTLTVEYYNDNNLDDNHWQDSSYWLPYNTAEFQPASVGLSALAQEVFDWINSQITTAVKLNPEDLQKNSSGQIEEANRAYDTSTFSGLGYRILRKNIQSNKNILTQSMINMPNTIYEIRYDFDLNGATINLPANSVLKFEGGQLKNGTINFNNCNIDNIGNSIILNNCTLKGSLNKQVIYSDWFYFNSDDCTDTLNDVFKISEGCRLIISEGVYKVSVKNLIGTDYADPMNTSILQPQSNSHITINGTIQLISNDRTHYNIIGIIDKDNILLDGTGEIIGDVETHTGTTGEWGHGVLISGSRNINVKDLRISYCWGDGLSVSYAEKILTDEGLVNSPYSPPKTINITNIKSSYNRRLGISIINGDGIILENSITEGNGTINGTSPKAGLDIEPNPNQSVNNVIVSGCLFYDNVVTYFPSNGLIEDKAISCIIQNSICKKQVTIGNVGKVIGCEIKYLLINGSRFVNIQNNVITEALVLSGTTITGLNVIDNTFLGLTTDGYDSCIRVSCDSFSKVNIASNNFSLCTNSNMRKLVTYTKKQTNAIDIVDSVITYDKTLTLLFYPYANFYNCEFIFSGFNIYNITSGLDKYPDSCSFIGCKFAANNSSFYIRDNITDNYKITIENCEYYTKQDNPTDFINYIGHTIALDLVVLNNKGKSVFLKNDIDEAHKRPIINNNYNGHRFYNLTNKRPEYYYNNNWWDSCGYNVNENRNSDGTLIEKVRIVSDSSKIINSNIIYVIVSDIDLQGETLTIPSNCTLDFQGGSFSNGTIIGNCKITGNVSNIFGDNLILFSTSNSNLQVIDSNQCKILANNSFISLSKRELLKVDDITSLFDIGVITASPHLITEYISNGYLKYDTTKIVITDNNGLIATTYDSAISYNVWDVTMLPITTGLTLDYIKPQMFSFANYSDKVTAAINYAQCYNLKVDIIEAFTLSKSIIISRSCYLNFNNKTITYSGTTALDAMIILCPINNQTASGSININNLTLNGNSLVDASILVLGLSKSKIDNLFSLNCSKAIYLHAITAIIYNQINGLKSYNVDYAIYSIPYFEDKNPANSFINGNLYQFGNTGSCNINAGFFNYGNGNTIAGGDSEPLGKKYCFVFNSERATLRDIMWLESDRNIRAINNSIITISGDIFSINGLNCDDSSIIESGEFNYTGYSYNQLQKLPQDRVFDLDSYIRFSTFNNVVYGYDLKNNNFINSNMTLSADTVSLIDDVFVRYGGCWLPIDSLEGKSVMFTINHRGTFSDYNMQDIIGVIQGNSLALPSGENTNTFLFRLGFKDSRQYDYLLPILSEYRTNANIGTEQKGVIKVILYFEKDASGNLVMYYNNTNVIVCPQAVYSTVSGNLFFFIQTNKYNYTLKDIAIFSKQLSTTEFYNVSKVLDNAVNHCPRYLSGTTANRPTLYTNQYGFQYYDTTLGKLILWNGTAWTNLDGSALA